MCWRWARAGACCPAGRSAHVPLSAKELVHNRQPVPASHLAPEVVCEPSSPHRDQGSQYQQAWADLPIGRLDLVVRHEVPHVSNGYDGPQLIYLYKAAPEVCGGMLAEALASQDSKIGRGWAYHTTEGMGHEFVTCTA